MSLVLARLIALVHLGFIAFLVAGAPLALYRPELIPAHVLAIVITIAINRTGSDCPLTVAEKRLLIRSGRVPYEHGFISHYLVEPIHAKGIGPRVNMTLLAAWTVPTVVAYSVLAGHGA